MRNCSWEGIALARDKSCMYAFIINFRKRCLRIEVPSVRAESQIASERLMLILIEFDSQFSIPFPLF